MAFSFDEVFVWGGQLVNSAKQLVPQALGVGNEKVNHTTYLQGNTQIGKVDAFSNANATLMVGREDTIGTNRSLFVKGNAMIEGDGGSGVNSVYVVGDMYVTGSVDCLSKGRLESRHKTADGKPKPFDIPHPTKGEGHRLRYACIEGPEVGVYCRGRVRNEKIIKLPDYWKDLVDVESISVQLQPIGAHQDVIIKRWDAETIHLQAQGGLPVNCFYHVYASRKDVNPLHVEYEGKDCFDYPDPNYGVDVENPVYNDPQYAPRRNIITI